MNVTEERKYRSCGVHGCILKLLLGFNEKAYFKTEHGMESPGLGTKHTHKPISLTYFKLLHQFSRRFSVFKRARWGSSRTPPLFAFHLQLETINDNAFKTDRKASRISSGLYCPYSTEW